MKYRDPELRQKLAMEYVLGTLKPLSRARFERLIDEDASLRRLVGDWETQFAQLDEQLSSLQPPDRLWQNLARRTQPQPDRRLLRWKLATGFASLVALACLAWQLFTPLAPPRVLAVLPLADGHPAWVAFASAAGELLLEPAGAPATDAAHDYELWSLAGGPPRPLGVLSRASTLRLRAPVLPANTVLAVSLEPLGGSPTGLPTGPVISQAALPSGI